MPRWFLLLLAGGVFVGATVHAEKVRTAPIEEQVNAALDRIVIPAMELQDSSLQNALDWLFAEVKRIDPNVWGDRGRIRIDFSARTPQAPPLLPSGLSGVAASPFETTRITLGLRYVSFREALNCVTARANLKYRVEDDGIRVVGMDADPPMATREYRIPESFLQRKAPESREEFVDRLKQKPGDVLKESGVTFPPGSAAIVNDAATRLAVHTTKEEFDLVEHVLNERPPVYSAAAAKSIPQPRVITLAEARRLALPALARQKLRAIILPEIAFEAVPLKDVIPALRELAIRYDRETPKADRGVKIRVLLSEGHATTVESPPAVEPISPIPPAPAATPDPVPPPNAPSPPADDAGRWPDLNTRITFAAKQISLLDALQAVVRVAHCRMRWDADVMVIEAAVPADGLISRDYVARSEWLESLRLPAPNPDPNWLLTGGVTFNQDPFAFYIVRYHRLIIRDTPAEIDRIRETIENRWLEYYQAESAKGRKK